jgi:hypothetical protein
VGDSAHERSTEGAEAPAAHDDQVGPQLLTRPDYLLGGRADGEMRLLYRASLLLYPLGLTPQERAGFLLKLLENVVAHLPGLGARVGNVRVERGVLYHG